MQYVIINRRIEHGRPDENKPYWWTCSPHFPHDTERNEN